MSDKKFEMIFWEGYPPSRGGYPGFKPRTERARGMIIERDVGVSMADGIKIYIDIFRPEQEGEYPVLISWGPYGKKTRSPVYPLIADVRHDISGYTNFEAADPVYWCAQGYIIINPDPRGSWNSEGDLTFFSDQEARDCADLIEWAGTQTWSNGKVGMYGVSYLAWSQWRVAELNPPHLAAINPWEGVSDFYRELCFHGGIPETTFLPRLRGLWSHTTTRVEDIVGMAVRHPLFDDYWAGKNADLSKITVPAFVVASWSDHGLHTRGTLEGFKQIASKDKWLMVHGRKKWNTFHEQANLDKQQQFFDRFLKGIDSDIKNWPRVMVEVRRRYGVGSFRNENEWPLARTQYLKLFLNGDDRTMSDSAPGSQAQVRYNVSDTYDGKVDNACFDFQFDKRTELTGYMKLKLWVEAAGSEDMDLFVAVQKIDPSGKTVPFAFLWVHDDGPVALGWLRVSHRELDENKSTPYQPFHKHQREIKLKPGEIVPVEIEIWPSSTLFEPGERLRVIVQGSDLCMYPGQGATYGHLTSVNRGAHIIHTGGAYDSHLLVPLIAPG